MNAMQQNRVASIISIRAIVSLACALLAISLPASAGNFAVSPIRLDLDASSKNGSITITNDADSDLKVQINLLEWNQDEAGKDGYRPSNDLLYFPRLANIPPKSKQVVRVGLRGPSTEVREKSYRLFVEELPENKPVSGTQLAIAVRFGVPLFVKPQKEEPAGRIENISMEKGQLHVVVRNSGNVHFKIESVTAKEERNYLEVLTGWYLLPAAKREYLFAIPPETCSKLKKLDIAVKADRFQLEGSLDVTPPMCGQK